MLTVHHLETSRSQRILWLLEELAVFLGQAEVEPDALGVADVQVAVGFGRGQPGGLVALVDLQRIGNTQFFE